MNKRNTLFRDVDTQFDFMKPEGRLYVPGAEAIIDTIRKVRRFALDDGPGAGTRQAVSEQAPSVGIIYKLVQYADCPLHKTSADEVTPPTTLSISLACRKLDACSAVDRFYRSYRTYKTYLPSSS